MLWMVEYSLQLSISTYFTMKRIREYFTILLLISLLTCISESKNVDFNIEDGRIIGENDEIMVKIEEKRLEALNENPEFEELRIIDDPAEIPKILAKPRNEHGDVIEEFKPIRLPTAFEIYDVDPRDGHIILKELIAVAGIAENVEAAFKASDIDGDGKITLEEFLHAPWSLGGTDDRDIAADMSYYADKDYEDYLNSLEESDETLGQNFQS